MAKVYEYILNAVDKVSPVLSKIGKGAATAYMGVAMFSQSAMAVNQTTELFERNAAAIERMAAPGVEFESSMADLSSITGIAGQELKDLGKISREVGKESGLGASGAVEAYKLLASQIDVSKIGMEGLNNLHSKTITLSQASGLSIQGSADAMAGTINQFGLAAGEANRVINVLAAGAKYGAAEIPDLAQSFKVAGASAAAAGLSVESTAGALEVLSKMNIKGSEAGTALRNVLLKMQTDLGVDFKVTKLSDALAGLAPKMGDATFMAKTFGAENIAAAQFLAKNALAVEEMTAQVTGTNVAMEQAEIRNATFSHRMDIMKAKVKDFGISFFESTKPMLPYIQTAAQASSTIMQFTPVLGGAGQAIQWMTTKMFATVAVTDAAGIATKKFVVVQKAQAFWQKASAAAMWLYNGAAAISGAVMNYLKGQLLKVRNAMAQGTVGTMLMSGAMGVASGAAGMFAIALKGVGMAFKAIPVIGWIAAIIGALIALFSILWNKSEWFRGMMGGLWGSVKAIFHNIGVFFGIVWDSLIKPVFLAIGSVIDWVKYSVLAPLGTFFGSVWNGIAAGVQWFGEVFSGAWNWITGILEMVGLKFTSFWDFVGSAFRLGAKIMFWPFTLLMKIFPDLAGWLEEKVWAPIQAMFDRILGKVQKLIEPIQKLWGKLFKNEKYENVGDAWAEGKQKGIDKFRQEQEDKKNKKGLAGLATEATPDMDEITPKYTVNPAELDFTDGKKGKASTRSATGGDGGNTYSEWLDRVNKKEDSSYTAIASSLAGQASETTSINNAPDYSKTAINNAPDYSKTSNSVVNDNSVLDKSVANDATRNLSNSSSVVQNFTKEEPKATMFELVTGIGTTLGKIAASVAIIAAMSGMPAKASEAMQAVNEKTFVERTVEREAAPGQPQGLHQQVAPIIGQPQGMPQRVAPTINITIQNITIQNTGGVETLPGNIADAVVKVLRDNLAEEILKLLS
jgi:TP901 family phage tail tape measure protein